MKGHDSSKERFSAKVRREAADWLTRKDAGLEPTERAELESWLAGAPERGEALRALEATWEVFTGLQAHGRGEAVLRLTELAERQVRQQRRQRAVWISLGLAASLMLAFSLPFSGSSDSPPGSPSATVTVMANRQSLADGTTVELAEGAEVQVAFTKATRAVRVLRGEALFAVAPDSSRPFVVSAGTVEVRAVGTEFSVRLGQDKVTVLVTEGKVAVDSSRGAEKHAEAGPHKTSPTLATAGSVVEVFAAAFDAPSLRTISADELRRELAWRDHRIEFNATPLSEAVRWVNRFNTRRLIVDPEAADLQITGVFWSDDPAGFARLIEASLGLQAIETAETIRLTTRR